MQNYNEINHHFQTPQWVCDIMASLVDGSPKKILEPTPGQGNLVKALRHHFPTADIVLEHDILTLQTNEPVRDFMAMSPRPVDWVVANPPFTPMTLGYQMLDRFFSFSPNVIALMPWLVLINSQARTAQLIQRGLCHVIHLPRTAFPGARVQTCILKFKEGHKGTVSLTFVEAP